MAADRPGFLTRLLGGGSVSDAPAEELPEVDLLEITDATFMLETARGHTLVDFWAPWCGPCRSFHPIYRQLAAEHADDPVRFARLNVDEAPRSAGLVGIQSIPTVILFDPAGNEVERIVGVPRRNDVQRLVKSASIG